MVETPVPFLFSACLDLLQVSSVLPRTSPTKFTCWENFLHTRWGWFRLQQRNISYVDSFISPVKDVKVFLLFLNHDNLLALEGYKSHKWVRIFLEYFNECREFPIVILIQIEPRYLSKLTFKHHCWFMWVLFQLVEILWF